MVYPLLLLNFLFCVVDNWYCNFILLGITYLLQIWMNYCFLWFFFYLLLVVHLTIVCVELSTFMDEYEWLTDWWLVRNLHTHLKGHNSSYVIPQYNYICLNCENEFLTLKNMHASFLFFFFVAKLFEFHIILYGRVIKCFCSWNFMKRKNEWKMIVSDLNIKFHNQHKSD